MSENIQEILDTVVSVSSTPMMPIFDYTTRIDRGTKELNPEELRKVVNEMKELAKQSDVAVITARSDGFDPHPSKVCIIDQNPGTSSVHLQAPFTIKILKRRSNNGCV